MAATALSSSSPMRRDESTTSTASTAASLRCGLRWGSDMRMAHHKALAGAQRVATCKVRRLAELIDAALLQGREGLR
jgi:hypothetical protein